MDVKANYNVDRKQDLNGLAGGLDASQPTSDQYFCARCDQKMPSGEKNEHDDWHFAKDLQDGDPNGATVSAPAPKSAPQAAAQTPDYAPPSYPPPVQGASRATAIYRHTNQVVEAGKVRAKDEVTWLSLIRKHERHQLTLS